MNWLQGGPFFELSFIIDEVEPLHEIINRLVNSSVVRMEIHNPLNIIEEFYEGYPIDEDEPEGKTVHQVCLNLTGVCQDLCVNSLRGYPPEGDFRAPSVSGDRSDLERGPTDGAASAPSFAPGLSICE